MIEKEKVKLSLFAGDIIICLEHSDEATKMLLGLV